MKDQSLTVASGHKGKSLAASTSGGSGKFLQFEGNGDTRQTHLGRDELNLAEFPIALVTEKALSCQKTLRFEDQIFDERRGQTVLRRLIISASDEYGLPTAKDDEVILGLIQLTREVNGFRERVVWFRRLELVRLLRWPETGPSYKRLALAFHRWLGVSLHYENAWWDRAEERWSTLGFHILESFHLTDSRQGRADLSRFTWNEDVFRSFQSGYLKQLDFEFYLSLRHPMAKRIYRFLDKRFYHRSRWEFDLKVFAFEHVGMSRNYEGNTQLARKLEPALRELEERGYLAPLPASDRYIKLSTSHWKVRLIKQTPGRSEVSTQVGHDSETRPEGATRLIERGVSERMARQLVKQHDCVRIAKKVEVFDWLLAKKDRRVGKNPAGYLVRSIQEDYEDPAEYRSALELVRKEHETKTRMETRSLNRGFDRISDMERDARVQSYWASLTEEERRQLEAEALQDGNPAFIKRYRRSLAEQSPLAAAYLRILIDERIGARLDSEPEPSQ